MSENVFILASDYYNHPVEDKPIIRIYGKTEDGETKTYYDDTFAPYFYLANPNKYDYRMLGSAGAQVVGKRKLEYEGEKLHCIKVETRKPYDVARLRDRLQSRGRTVFSGDILFQLRYSYDKDLERALLWL